MHMMLTFPSASASMQDSFLDPIPHWQVTEVFCVFFVKMWVTLIILCLRGVVSVLVSGTIEDNKSFYYQELPTQPSTLATISYSITYPLANSDYVDFQLYTTSSHVNIDRKCTVRNYGQIYNIKMYHDSRATWNSCRQFGGSVHCERRVTIQDYIPRKFGFSLGFSCKDVTTKSLKGTSFAVDVFSQRNETTCSAMPKLSVNCSRFHSLVSLPNLLGESTNRAPYWFEHFFGTLNQISFPTDCYVHLEEFVCNIYFPQCDAQSQSIIVPCREMFEDLEMGCVIGSLVVEILTATTLGTYDNNYFPPRDGNISCFYKPVVCGPPPNATDILIVGGLNDSGIYYGGAELQYACTDESMITSGNSTVTCLYNGRWSSLPVCVEPDRKYLPIILLPVLSVLVICVLLVAIVMIKRRRKRAPNLLLTRMKDFDAYVCYDFDGNQDFVMDTILPAFEENQDPPFKLVIHSRDFEPGVKIFDNIQKAISQSNSAIIIMSQEFVNSLWCKKEFEQCFIENMNDPAFKLFLIMMQPADTLEGLSEYMTSFITQKTYLERDDPDLIRKISEYLNLVKQPKEDKRDRDDDDDNNEEVQIRAENGSSFV